MKVDQMMSALDALGDAKVIGLSWSGDDLIVEMLLAGTSATVRKVKLTDVCELRISLDFGRYVGAPMLFEVDSRVVEPNILDIEFQFGIAPEGFISLKCTDVKSMPD